MPERAETTPDFFENIASRFGDDPPQPPEMKTGDFLHMIFCLDRKERELAELRRRNGPIE